MHQTQPVHLDFEGRERPVASVLRDRIATDAPPDYDAQMAAVPQLAYGLRILILIAVVLSSAAMLGALVWGALKLGGMILR